MRRDLACAAAGLALAGAYGWLADSLPKSLLADNVGADGVPKALAVLLASFSVAIAIKAVIARSTLTGVPPVLKPLGIAALGFLYVALAPLVGYLLSVAALAAAAALYYGAPRRPAILAFAFGSAVLLWAVFQGLLGVPLP